MIYNKIPLSAFYYIVGYLCHVRTVEGMDELHVGMLSKSGNDQFQ